MPGVCPIFDTASSGEDAQRSPWKDRLCSVNSRVLESLFLLILLASPMKGIFEASVDRCKRPMLRIIGHQ